MVLEGNAEGAPGSGEDGHRVEPRLDPAGEVLHSRLVPAREPELERPAMLRRRQGRHPGAVEAGCERPGLQEGGGGGRRRQCSSIPLGYRSATRFSWTPCSRNALRPASTSENPWVESATCFTSASPSPMNPEWVIRTNVVPSFWGENAHSTVVGLPSCPGHSTTIRRFGSIAFTATGIEMPYISHSHCTCWPASSRPLPLVNQNFVVTSGLTNASKTSATGLRMSMPVFVTGTCVS